MTGTIATAKPWRDAVGIEMQIRDGLKKIKYGKCEGQTVESARQE
ncbi:MAG: histidine phosphatase family protein [Cyanobacteriota bacterium]|nr:histidine phosphatase family protein [Cyanobacteriota bacterium]